jgi:hypothetical protein
LQDSFSTEIDEPDLELIAKVVPKVTEVINEKLIKPYRPEEVKEALFTIGDMKTPGVHGLHAIFFENWWNFLGDVDFWKQSTIKLFLKVGTILSLFSCQKLKT